MAGRVLFPKTGFTTEDLTRLYEHLAPVLLPYLAERPLTLKRFPDDIHGEAFWEKDAPNFTPKWIRRLAVPRKHQASLIHYISLSDTESLRWAASVGCVEIHSFLHRYPFLTSPTLIAFNLDPGPGLRLGDCCAVALDVREWLAGWGLESFAKVSGSKGMQVYVPLNTPSSYSVTQPVARRVAEDLERRSPDRVISRMARAERGGKVFIDWSQNAVHKTTVSVYSVRAKSEEPWVSMPISWVEVERASATAETELLRFSPGRAVKRIQEIGDIFSEVPTLPQTVPGALLAELGLAVPPDPLPVSIQERNAGGPTLPRSSGQGGRRLFLVHLSQSEYEFGLEQDGKFRLFQFRSMPTRDGQTVTGTEAGMTSLDYLTNEATESGLVWDLGTYELVEGRLEKCEASIYLSGRRLHGPWKIARTNDNWALTCEGGRVKRGLTSNGSALTGIAQLAGSR